MQIARLKSSFHGDVTNRGRVAGKTKGCGAVRERRTVRGGFRRVNTDGV